MAEFTPITTQEQLDKVIGERIAGVKAKYEGFDDYMSQSALGYSVTGTYLIPGGGLFIKKSELSRLGLRRQRVGVMDIYGIDDQGNSSNTV